MGWRGSTSTDHVMLALARVGPAAASEVRSAIDYEDWERCFEQEERRVIQLSVQNVDSRLGRLQKRGVVVCAQGNEDNGYMPTYSVMSAAERRRLSELKRAAAQPPWELVARAIRLAAELPLHIWFVVAWDKKKGWGGFVCLDTPRGSIEIPVGMVEHRNSREYRWMIAAEEAGI